MALAVDFFCFFSWRPSVKVQGRVILCSNDHFRKWASKCEVLSSPEMAMIDRLAGFHFQVTFNCDYSCPLLIWVVCAEVCFALIWNGTVYILKWFRPASKGSDHFEYFVVIWQTDKQTNRPKDIVVLVKYLMVYETMRYWSRIGQNCTPLDYPRGRQHFRMTW